MNTIVKNFGLETPEGTLLSKEEFEREKFLKGRMAGIGGSDVAAILGVSPYKSPYMLWLNKTGREESKSSQSEAAHFGNMLEEVVAKEFQRRNGLKVQRVNKQLTVPNEPWVIGNIDRAVINPKISGNVRFKDGALTTDMILECKTASEYMSSLFGEEGTDLVPDYYLTQCMWYLFITGAKICFLAVLIGGNKYRQYRIERDDELIDSIFKQAKSFWVHNVLADNPPEATTFDDVNHRWSKHIVGKQVEADSKILAFSKELVRVKATIKKLEEHSDEIQLEIVKTMQDAESLTSSGVQICTYKAQTTKRFNAKALKESDAETHEKFTYETTSRTFRIGSKFKASIKV